MFVRYAHRRALALDRMDAGRAQDDTLLRLVRTAADTRFGRDHDFARIRSVADFQARVPIRDYEWFWDDYWKDAYPRLDGVTWPGRRAVLRPVVRHHQRGDEVHPGDAGDGRGPTRRRRSPPWPCSATPGRRRQLFTGKFFFLGGSTDLRPQADGSLAGDLSGIAAREVPASCGRTPSRRSS